MEESTLEIILGILARLGIVSAHGFEVLTGTHTLMAVMILWSFEELIAVRVSARHLKKRHSGALEKGVWHLFRKEQV